MLIHSKALRHCVQLAWSGLGVEHNASLLQNPGFYLFMVDAQQVKGSHRVMLFSSRARLVSHQLRHHASGYFQPLRQRLE